MVYASTLKLYSFIHLMFLFTGGQHFLHGRSSEDYFTQEQNLATILKPWKILMLALPILTKMGMLKLLYKKKISTYCKGQSESKQEENTNMITFSEAIDQ